MNISVDLIKELREITMASLKDCKESLIEANGDIEQAKEILKKKWLASAMKKWDRETKEWKFGYKISWDRIGICKLWCETDFVAKNEIFISLIDSVLDIAMEGGDIESYDQLDWSKKDQIDALVWEIVWKLGENMRVADLIIKPIWADHAYTYLHAWDKLIAIVYYNGEVDQDSIKKVALQIAAMDPLYLSVENIPSEDVEKMKKEFKDEVIASGKPEAVAENIVNGKLNKKYSEIVLLEQGYIWDESQKIKDIVWDAKIVWFDRMSF